MKQSSATPSDLSAEEAAAVRLSGLSIAISACYGLYLMWHAVPYLKLLFRRLEIVDSQLLKFVVFFSDILVVSPLLVILGAAACVVVAVTFPSRLGLTAGARVLISIATSSISCAAVAILSLAVITLLSQALSHMSVLYLGFPG